MGRAAQPKREGVAAELCTVRVLSRTPVDRLAQRPERLSGEDGLDRELKELTDTEGELEAGIEIAPLDVADSLIVDAEGIGEILAGQGALGAKHW